MLNDIATLKSVPTESINMARENVWSHIGEFEAALQQVACLPDMAHGDAIQKLQARLAKLSAENDQLRSVVRVANDHNESLVAKMA
jgi:cell division protein FtsB